jgi:hypothetical protein
VEKYYDCFFFNPVEYTDDTWEIIIQKCFKRKGVRLVYVVAAWKFRNQNGKSVADTIVGIMKFNKNISLSKLYSIVDSNSFQCNPTYAEEAAINYMKTSKELGRYYEWTPDSHSPRMSQSDWDHEIELE